MHSVSTLSKLTVFQPSGHINAANASVVQERLNVDIAHTHSHAFLVDMSQVKSLDSAGLMALVFALSLSQRQNKRFGLCGVSPAIRIIFELTQLDRVFEIFESQVAFEEAIA